MQLPPDLREYIAAQAGRVPFAELERADGVIRKVLERQLLAVKNALLIKRQAEASSDFTQAMGLMAGEIGKLFYFKQRSAHNGPKEIGCDPHFWHWLYDEELNGAGARSRTMPPRR